MSANMTGTLFLESTRDAYLIFIEGEKTINTRNKPRYKHLGLRHTPARSRKQLTHAHPHPHTHTHRQRAKQPQNEETYPRLNNKTASRLVLDASEEQKVQKGSPCRRTIKEEDGGTRS